MADLLSAKEKEIAAMKGLHLQELAQAKPPKGDLADDTVKVLKLFFDNDDDVSAGQIARHFRMQPSVAKFHVDKLMDKKFVRLSRMGMSGYGGDTPAMFAIASAGREYIIEHNLAG